MLRRLPVDWPAAWERCRSYCESFDARSRCRTLDALHVACAAILEWDRFATSDRRQGGLARLVGLATVDPLARPARGAPGRVCQGAGRRLLGGTCSITRVGRGNTARRALRALGTVVSTGQSICRGTGAWHKRLHNVLLPRAARSAVRASPPHAVKFQVMPPVRAARMEGAALRVDARACPPGWTRRSGAVM